MPNELDKHAQRALTAKTEASLMNRLRAYINNSDPVEVAFWSIQFVALIALLIFEANKLGQRLRHAGQGCGSCVFLRTLWASPASSLMYRPITGPLTLSEPSAQSRLGSLWALLSRVPCLRLLAFCRTSALRQPLAPQPRQRQTRSGRLSELKFWPYRPRQRLRLSINHAPLCRLLSVKFRHVRTRLQAGAWADATQEDCRADLRPRERQICNDLNGDGQRMGLRNELEMHKARVLGLETKSERLSMLRTKLGSLQYTEGSAHWQAMEKLTGGSVQQDALRIYISLFISLGLLLVLGMGFDALFEKNRGRDRGARQWVS